MKELALLEHEREDQDSIFKCIEDIKEELEKYDYLRSFSQPIDGSITKIEKEHDKYEEKPLKSKDVENSKKKLKTLDMDMDLVEMFKEIVAEQFLA